MPRHFAPLLALALSMLVSPVRAEPWADDLGAVVAERVARPFVERFRITATEQVAAVDALCERPDPASLQAVREAFASSLEAFGAVSVLRFGPLTSDNRLERLSLWPDARGAAVRQVEALLAEPEAPVGDLAGRSVALQGLPALEFALFGTDAAVLATPQGAHRCDFAQAVSARIAITADEIAAAWADGTPFARAFVDPSNDTDPFRSQAEVAAELVKAIGTAIQFARDAQIVPALGDDPAKANGRRAPFWRSDLTFTLIAAELEAANVLLAAAGFEEALPVDAGSNVASVAFDLHHAAQAVARIETPAQEAFAEPKDRETLRYATVALKNAQRILNEKVTADLGLRTGFNALDGD